MKAFLCGLLAFGLANAASVLLSDDPDLPDGMSRFGFPFFIEEQGETVNYFSPLALFGDVAIAVIGSASGALIFARKRPGIRHRHRFHRKHPPDGQASHA
jgi:hypothetical protein